jgi:protein-S-isoprenylcysteine O-methyltransferase Ste14
MFIFARPNLQSLIVGFFLVIAGEALRLWGVSIIGSETRTTGSAGGTYLITTGPFAYVRNPLYIGNLLLYTGVGVMSNALFPWLLIAAVLFFFIQYYLIVILEEEYLVRTFGGAFADYARHVHRFLPNFKKYNAAGGPQLSKDLRRGLRSDVRTLQALLLISLALVVLWQLRS